jgi:hypothetical protein
MVHLNMGNALSTSFQNKVAGDKMQLNRKFAAMECPELLTT